MRVPSSPGTFLHVHSTTAIWPVEKDEVEFNCMNKSLLLYAKFFFM